MSINSKTSQAVNNSSYLHEFLCEKHPTELLVRVCNILNCPKIFMCVECMKEDPVHLEEHSKKIQSFSNFKESLKTGVASTFINSIETKEKNTKMAFKHFEKLEIQNIEKIKKEIEYLRNIFTKILHKNLEKIEQNLCQISNEKNKDCKFKLSQLLNSFSKQKECVKSFEKSTKFEIDDPVNFCNSLSLKKIGLAQMRLMNEIEATLNANLDFSDFLDFFL